MGKKREVQTAFRHGRGCSRVWRLATRAQQSAVPVIGFPDPKSAHDDYNIAPRS